MKKISIIIATLLFSITSSTLFAQREEYNHAIINDDREAIIRFGEQLLSTGQPSKEVYRRLALAYKDKNSYSKSIDYLNRAYLLDSNDVKTSLALGEAYLNYGDEDKAMLSFMKVLDLDSTNTQALSIMLKIHLSNNNKPSAIQTAIKLCDIDSTNAAYFRNLGRLYETSGGVKYALHCYLKAVALNPTHLGNIILLSNAQIMNNQLDSSIRTVKGGLAIAGNLTSRSALLLRRNLANAYYRKKEYDSCLAQISTLKADGDTLEAYNYKLGGFASFKKGFFLDASEDLQVVYNKSEVGDSLSFDIPFYLGKAYYEINDTKNANKYFSKVIKNLQPNYTQLYNGHMAYAKSLSQGKSYNLAIENFNKAKEYDLESPEPYTEIANIYERSFKDYKKGIEELTKYLNLAEKMRSTNGSISSEMESSSKYIKKRIERSTESFFFQSGADGQKKVIFEKRNNKGEVIERKEMSLDEFKKQRSIK